MPLFRRHRQETIDTLQVQLFQAAESGNTRTLDTLIKAGVDLNYRDHEQSWTALMHAIEGGHSDTAKLLIQSGADVNAKATTGITALMAAAVKGDVGLARALLDHGADSSAEDMHGKTAYDLVQAKIDALGRYGDADLLVMRGLLAPQRRPHELPGQEQDAITLPSEVKALLEEFLAAEPSILDDDGVCVKRASRREGTCRVFVGSDGPPAAKLAKIPGACDMVMSACKADEYERFLVAAGDFSNPEWCHALARMGTSRAAGVILAGWTYVRRADDPSIALGIEALIQLGPMAHDRVLRALDPVYTADWFYPEIKRQFRYDLLSVLAATGDWRTVRLLRELGALDESLSVDAEPAVVAITARLTNR